MTGIGEAPLSAVRATTGCCGRCAGALDDAGAAAVRRTAYDANRTRRCRDTFASRSATWGTEPVHVTDRTPWSAPRRPRRPRSKRRRRRRGASGTQAGPQSGPVLVDITKPSPVAIQLDVIDARGKVVEHLDCASEYAPEDDDRPCLAFQGDPQNAIAHKEEARGVRAS